MTGTKDEIDWSHVAPEYNWMARDEDGEPCLYHDKPWLDEMDDHWSADLCNTISVANSFSSYKRGTCDWRDSLVRRPE